MRSVVLSALLVLALAAPARAQLVGADWGASSAGHLAFVTQGNYGGRATLRIVSPDGRVSAAETITDSSETPEVALGARGDALVAWFDDEHRLYGRRLRGKRRVGRRGPAVRAPRPDPLAADQPAFVMKLIFPLVSSTA